MNQRKTCQTPIDIQPHFTENNGDEARGELTMPTTYRLIRVALSALALTGATPAKTVTDQSEKGQNQSVESTQLSQIANALEKANEPPKLDSGCKAGVDDRDSDLCAQWKAADAASKAAWWAMVSIFITGLGTLGLFWQISLTRRAVQDTARATEAMNEANRIAYVAQRPWVEIEAAFHWALGYRDHLVLSCSLKIRNLGNTVASNVQISNIAFSEYMEMMETKDEFLAQPYPSVMLESPGIQPRHSKGFQVLPKGEFTHQTLVWVTFDPDDQRRCGFRSFFLIKACYDLTDGTVGETAAAFSAGVRNAKGGLDNIRSLVDFESPKQGGGSINIESLGIDHFGYFHAS